MSGPTLSLLKTTDLFNELITRGSLLIVFFEYFLSMNLISSACIFCHLIGDNSFLLGNFFQFKVDIFKFFDFLDEFLNCLLITYY